MDKEFIRVRSTKDITISAVTVIAGIILAVVPASTPLNIVGYCALFTGIILVLAVKTGYKDKETGVKYCKTEHFFAQSLRQSICDAICSKPDSVDLSEEDKGNGVRLDIYHSKASGKAYIQLFEYIPYKYEPCSKLYEHDLDKINKLIR